MFRNPGFYVIRRPVLSLEQLIAFHQNTVASSLGDALLEWYRKNNDLAGEALFLASPALYDRYTLWLENSATISEQQQLEMTLYQYLIRMCTRSTPYGLFSGCSFAYIDHNPNTYIAARDELFRYTRLDSEYLDELRDRLTTLDPVRSQIRIAANPTLYLAGDRFRYVEQSRDNGRQESFVTATDDTPFLRLILEGLTQDTTFACLLNLLLNAGVQEAAARPYLSDLIDGQILFFDLGAALTAPSQLEVIADRVGSVAGTGRLTEQFRELQNLLKSQEAGIGKYRRIGACLKTMNISRPTQSIVHVDTFFGTHRDEVVKYMIENLQSRLEKLIVFNRFSESKAMQQFKRHFTERYEGMEIPFNLALDPETGIGYGHTSAEGYTPLLDDLAIPGTDSGEFLYQQWWIDFLLNKYSHAIRHPENEIILTDDDFSYIADRHTAKDQNPGFEKAPYGCFLMGNLLTSSPEAAATNDYLFHVSALSGPSALPLLGRFACGDKNLESRLRQFAAAEEAFHPDVILAEVIYKPEGRIANIAAHPAFYRYEIPYLGQASVADDFRIPVDDLLISIRDGKVILRSRRLNRRIIPRLSNAHNYRTGLPVYRFLCDLQYQDAHLDIRWDWSALKNSDYLPRVRYHNILLSRATWTLREEEIQALPKTEITAALVARGLPDQFVIVSGDNELLIDRNVPCSIELLILQLRKHKTLRLAEFLTTPGRSWLQKNGAHYAHELVIPLRNEKASPLKGFSQAQAEQVPEKFLTGSEWLYLKVYCGAKSAAALLVKQLYPAIREMLEDGIVTKFFFVNFSDPDFHLRLRFLGNPSSGFHQRVITAIRELLQPLLDNGLVSRVQTDTYRRELERYGAARIALCETYFYLDSLATLQFLRQREDMPTEDELIVYTTGYLHQILSAAGLSEFERAQLTDQLKEHFFEEFQGTTSLRKQLGDKYRKYRVAISQTLSKTNSPVSRFPIQFCLAELAAKCSTSKEFHQVLVSLIHMSVNRIFPVKPRMYELILYHFLARFYRERCARSGVDTG